MNDEQCARFEQKTLGKTIASVERVKDDVFGHLLGLHVHGRDGTFGEADGGLVGNT